MQYIQKFWVGLMDADGCIQVNHWRKKYCQFRLVIKLKNTPSNYNMLIVISKQVGGYVRISKTESDVFWIENSSKKIQKIIGIFEKYPPLTLRLQCQLEFLKQCFIKKDVLWYLENRSLKYTQKLRNSQNDIHTISYFPEWLSGFIEAEGCFSIRTGKKKIISFSLGQKTDLILIEAIKIYFKASNTIRTVSKDFYLLEIYKKESLKNIIFHLEKYPLLGEKKNSFLKFLHTFET